MVPDVLLVEDDPDLRDEVASFLRFNGFSVRESGGVAQAAGAVRFRKPDVALIDVLLPDGSGLALLPILRTDAPRFDPKSGTAVVLGAGGAARAVPVPSDLSRDHARTRNAHRGGNAFDNKGPDESDSRDKIAPQPLCCNAQGCGAGMWRAALVRNLTARRRRITQCRRRAFQPLCCHARA